MSEILWPARGVCLAGTRASRKVGDNDNVDERRIGEERGGRRQSEAREGGILPES
jgi:hypothetical protein